MDCIEYLEMISEEIDGELKEDRSLTLMRHLVVCEDCLQEYKALFRIGDMLKEESLHIPLLVPEGFSKKIVNILDSEVSPNVAEIEITERRTPPPIEKGFSIFNLFPAMSKPVMQLSFAMSLILVISLSLLYNNKTTTDVPTGPSLLNAKKIEPKSIEKTVVAKEEDKGELNYYVKRHTAALNSRRANNSMIHRNNNITYATYSRIK